MALALRYRRTRGFSLLALFILQAVFTLANTLPIPRPPRALVGASGHSLDVVAANTRPGEQCSYYRWSSIAAAVLPKLPPGRATLSTIGFGRSLLLVVVVNNTILYSLPGTTTWLYRVRVWVEHLLSICRSLSRVYGLEAACT